MFWTDNSACNDRLFELDGIFIVWAPVMLSSVAAFEANDQIISFKTGDVFTNNGFLNVPRELNIWLTKI